MEEPNNDNDNNWIWAVKITKRQGEAKQASNVPFSKAYRDLILGHWNKVVYLSAYYDFYDRDFMLPYKLIEKRRRRKTI